MPYPAIGALLTGGSSFLSRKMLMRLITYVGTSAVFIFGGDAVEKSIDSVQGLVETALNPFKSILATDEASIRRNSQFIAAGLLFALVFSFMKKLTKIK